MKALRLILLLVLATLLPLRGALASVSHCIEQSMGAMVVVADAAVADADDAASHCHGHEDTASAAEADPVPEAPGNSLGGLGCDCCSALCASPPLPVAALAPLPTPVAVAPLYPALDAPRANHAGDGLERPPRRC